MSNPRRPELPIEEQPTVLSFPAQPDEVILPPALTNLVGGVIREALKGSQALQLALQGFVLGRELEATYDLQTTPFDVKLVRIPDPVEPAP